MTRIFSSTSFRLFLAVVAGLLTGQFATESVIAIILPIKHVLGQLIFFLIPLLIFGFIAPSITKLNENASSLLGVAAGLAYVSCIGSAILAAALGYTVIPLLHVGSETTIPKEIPEMLFRLDIPPLMSVLGALALAFLVGLSVLWAKAKKIESALYEFQNIVFVMVKKFLIPVLPFFIAANFSVFAYEGALLSKLPTFIVIILLAILCHIIWLGFLYVSAGIYSKKNPWQVLKYYGPVALTALGTQSSAASLGVAIEQTRKSPVLKPGIRDFSIPLLGNIHFPGSILDIVLLTLAVSQLLYGTMPGIEKMILFIPLLAIFGIAAPGLPGGTLYASLGLIYAVIGMDEAGTALMITIFALLDSFGTTHNITSDGALTLILTRYAERGKE
ncbi:MAG: cation:dicarboxylase symporter family transporter [Breznakibacter sp.]